MGSKAIKLIPNTETATRQTRVRILTKAQKDFLFRVEEVGLEQAQDEYDLDDDKLQAYRAANPDFSDELLARLGMTRRMEKCLEVYAAQGARVSYTTAKMRMARETFYRWRRECPYFAEKLLEIEDSLIDTAEEHLMKNIKGGNVQAQMFFLRTKGANRGYQTTSKIETKNTNVNVEVVADVPKTLPEIAARRKLLEAVINESREAANGGE